MFIKANSLHIPLKDESVQCVVTSPPYWGLRDYGAIGQIGLEKTPHEYIQKLLVVFKEVKRVLKMDGTLWLNLGDCYATGAGKVGNCPGGGEQGERWKGYRGTRRSGKHEYVDCAMGPLIQPNRMPISGFKPKDLVGIPWMVAFALRDEGWYLRSDIIWAKPQCMPESVKDRPTKSHEYIFLFSKSERYFYDWAAIMEPCKFAHEAKYDPGTNGLGGGDRKTGKTTRRFRSVPDCYKGSVPGRSDGPGQERRSSGDRMERSGNKERKTGEDRGRPGSHLGGSIPWEGSMRNKRSVWNVGTQPYNGAHFAVWPEKLVEPMILAGCPVGGIILDPFVGSGTTVRVAERLGRIGIGLDLGYQELAKQKVRNNQKELLFR